MRYQFSGNELEEFTKFLLEAMRSVENIVTQILRRITIFNTSQRSLVFEDVFCQLQLLKRRFLFWGLMDMAMLICQLESMLRALQSGRLLINQETIGLLGDITNTCQGMIGELYQGIGKGQNRETLEIELACSQETAWLIDFLQQLLQQKPSRALVSVPQPLVSKLPVIIKNPIVFLENYSQDKFEKSNADKVDSSQEIRKTIHEMVEVEISTSVTVTDEKVDSLLQIVGELATAQNIFSKLSGKLLMAYNLPNLSREVRAGGVFVREVATALEDAVMSMRRVALGLIFMPFSHIVGNIGLQTGKNICLTITGENITADKAIIKPLYNLLLPIITTMANVNIEPSIEREAVGKKHQGHIWLTAYYSRQQLMIEVEDDGRGMKGGDADAKVLEISDLMVTMNEVCQHTDALPGKLEITSFPGKGNKVRITLPPPLMKCRGLLVEVASELLIVPLDHVVEIVRVNSKQLVSQRGRQLFYHRGEVLGIVSVAESLGMMKEPNEGSVTILVVTNGQANSGLLVHKLHNEQEIVIKPLPDYLKNSEYIIGAAVTGDGGVALVLNVSVLINKN